jgi:hypothetical protein
MEAVILESIKVDLALDDVVKLERTNRAKRGGGGGGGGGMRNRIFGGLLVCLTHESQAVGPVVLQGVLLEVGARHREHLLADASERLPHLTTDLQSGFLETISLTPLSMLFG